MEISSSVCGAAAVAACAAVAGGVGRGAVQAVSAATAAASRRRRSIIASVYVAAVTCRSHRCAGVVEDAARLVADSGGSRASVIREPAPRTKNCGQHGGGRGVRPPNRCQHCNGPSLPAPQTSARRVSGSAGHLRDGIVHAAGHQRGALDVIGGGAPRRMPRPDEAIYVALVYGNARAQMRPHAHPRSTRTAAALAQLSGQTDLRQPRLQPGAPTPAATSLPAATRPVWSAARHRSRSVRHWHR